MATMLRLLQPVDSSWKKLARYLLPEEQRKVESIEGECFHENTYHEALDDVFVKWLGITRKAKRTWQTLCSFAEEYNKEKKKKDESLEKYMKENNLKGKF